MTLASIRVESARELDRGSADTTAPITRAGNRMPWLVRLRLMLQPMKTPLCVIVMIAVAAFVTLELIQAVEWLTMRSVYR